MEVVGPVLPLALVVALLQVTVVKAPGALFARFGLGVVLVMVGLFLFLLGVKIGILPVGEYLGSHLPVRAGLPLMVGVALVLGFTSTVAEPDVRVLGLAVEQVTDGSIGSNSFILLVSLGLAVAFAGAIVRQLTKVRLALVLGLGYGLVLMLLPFVSPQYVALALDSGSTTTGSLSVPLILAMGIGVARVTASSALEEGFGLIGIASMGPVLLLTIVGVFI